MKQKVKKRLSLSDRVRKPVVSINRVQQFFIYIRSCRNFYRKGVKNQRARGLTRARNRAKTRVDTGTFARSTKQNVSVMNAAKVTVQTEKPLHIQDRSFRRASKIGCGKRNSVFQSKSFIFPVTRNFFLSSK